MLRLVRGDRCFSKCKNAIRKSYHERFAFSTSVTGEDAESRPSEVQAKASPPPIRVGFTESAGRGVFATRRIGIGELIHTAKPVVAHPSLSSLGKICYFCLRKLAPETRQAQSCSFCCNECRQQSEAFYDVERRANWSTFNEYCRVQDVKYPLLVKRFACMVIAGVACDGSLDILQPATLSSEMVAVMEKEFSLLRNILSAADIMDQQLAFMTKEWYAGILARIRINAFRVELVGGVCDDLLTSAAAIVEADSGIGNAVYMLPSFYNHDCDPNAHILWIDNADAKLKALRDIEAGEELRICYIDASMHRDTRQRILHEGFGFQCSCHRCLSND